MDKAMLLGAALLVSAALLFPYTAFAAKTAGVTKRFEADGSVFGNPLMGFAPQATEETVEEDVTLLYVEILWREWEPERSEFQIEAIREKYQLDRWRQEGKHIVLRFVCDKPGKESHCDIPAWLYRATDKAGTWYDSPYGQGFSPDYSNEFFIERHARAVRELGRAFGQDGFVSYVELGSLGHWGEWHVHDESGIDFLPGPEIRRQYIEAWREAFPHAKILMRRPFAAAENYGFGLYNDMIGEPESTARWLDWIENGGVYDETQVEDDLLAPMPQFWQTAPSGGEMTSSVEMKTMLKEHFERTLAQVDASHTTFIGPKTAPSQYKKARETLLGHMGYRLAVTQAELAEEKKQMRLTLTWVNRGAAPMYWNWPVYVFVTDLNNEVVSKTRVSLLLTGLIPGVEIRTQTMLDIPSLKKDFGLWIGIEDPMTGRCAVRLDMKTQRMDGMMRLF